MCARMITRGMVSARGVAVRQTCTPTSKQSGTLSRNGKITAVSRMCSNSDVAVHRFCIPADKIIIYGQSIGTVPSVDLATKVPCAGVVLHSPLASGLRVLRPSTTCTLCCDPFPSINKIQHIKAPILLIHGEKACFDDKFFCCIAEYFRMTTL